MTGYGKAHQLDKCFTIFAAFKDKYGTLSAISYNILMGCCLMNRRPDRAIELMDQMKAEGVQPLSYLGWDVATEGISRINRLEKSWDSVQKQPASGIPAYCDLIQLCVECNRPDLVQRIIDITQQSETLNWQAVERQLSESTAARIKEWISQRRIHTNAKSTEESDQRSAQQQKPNGAQEVTQSGEHETKGEAKGLLDSVIGTVTAATEKTLGAVGELKDSLVDKAKELVGEKTLDAVGAVKDSILDKAKGIVEGMSSIGTPSEAKKESATPETETTSGKAETKTDVAAESGSEKPEKPETEQGVWEVKPEKTGEAKSGSEGASEHEAGGSKSGGEAHDGVESPSKENVKL